MNGAQLAASIATSAPAKRFGQAFSKACGFLGQCLASRVATRDAKALRPARAKGFRALLRTGSQAAASRKPSPAHRISVRWALPLCLGYALVLAFTLAPLLLLGQNASLPLLDWLDGDITGKVLLGRNLFATRDYFAPQVPQMMQSAAVWGNAPSTLLYAWLPPFAAYVAECFFAVSAAYWGMTLFLRRLLALVTGHTDEATDAANAKDGNVIDDDIANANGADSAKGGRSLNDDIANTNDAANANAADSSASSTRRTPTASAADATPAPCATQSPCTAQPAAVRKGRCPLLCAAPNALDGTILCTAVAIIFACLPFYTVHDLTTMGIPLVLWAFLVLWQAGQATTPARACHTSPVLSAAAYGAVLLFGLCSTLAFSGYFIVGFLALFLLVALVQALRCSPTRRAQLMALQPLALAFALLCAVYGATNFSLVQSVFGLGDSAFVSHRTVYAPGTLAAGEVFSEFKTMLLRGQYHATSKHFLALAVAVASLAVTLPLWKQLARAQKRLWLFCAGLLATGVAIAAFYAFCGTALYARSLAVLGSALASFQFDRLYFLYPTLWYTLLACALILFVSAGPALVRAVFVRCSVAAQRGAAQTFLPAAVAVAAFSQAAMSASAPAVASASAQAATAPQATIPVQRTSPLPQLLLRTLAALALCACFAFVLLRGNYQLDNWRAAFTGVQPNGGVTWRQFFAEDLFAEIRASLHHKMAEDAAGSTVGALADRAPVVVSLGLSPAIALYNGFSTLDGYSNNYALSYHNQFGKVLQGELAKDAALAAYFYDWGNRCYFFTPQLGRDFSYQRGATDTPEQPPKPLKALAFDWEALRAMGGTHVLSLAPIAQCTQYGLTDCGEFYGEYYSVYTYAL